MKRSIQLAVVVTCLAVYAAPASAEKCAGVTMPERIEVSGDELVLNGMGVRKATVFSIDVYVAGLYLEERSSNGTAIPGSDQKKKFVMAFVRDVGRDDIVDTYKNSFEHTARGLDLDDKLSKLLGWMEAMKRGETQIFTYVPDEGLTVKVKGEKMGAIEGAEFAEAFFKNWLGSNPPNPGLKRGMLGGPCE